MTQLPVLWPEFALRLMVQGELSDNHLMFVHILKFKLGLVLFA